MISAVMPVRELIEGMLADAQRLAERLPAMAKGSTPWDRRR
jgi:hypothetical protein